MSQPYRALSQRLGDEGGEALADAVEPDLHRSLGHAEQVGDRGMCEVRLVPQVHELALLLGERGERLTHAHAADELVLERLAGHGLLLGVAGSRPVPLLPGPEPQRLVASDLRDPRAGRGRVVAVAALAPSAGHRLLGGFVGGLGVAKNAQRFRPAASPQIPPVPRPVAVSWHFSMSPDASTAKVVPPILTGSGYPR